MILVGYLCEPTAPPSFSFSAILRTALRAQSGAWGRAGCFLRDGASVPRLPLWELLQSPLPPTPENRPEPCAVPLSATCSRLKEGTGQLFPNSKPLPSPPAGSSPHCGSGLLGAGQGGWSSTGLAASGFSPGAGLSSAAATDSGSQVETPAGKTVKNQSRHRRLRPSLGCFGFAGTPLARVSHVAKLTLHPRSWEVFPTLLGAGGGYSLKSNRKGCSPPCQFLLRVRNALTPLLRHRRSLTQPGARPEAPDLVTASGAPVSPFCRRPRDYGWFSDSEVLLGKYRRALGRRQRLCSAQALGPPPGNILRIIWIQSGEVFPFPPSSWPHALGGLENVPFTSQAASSARVLPGKVVREAPSHPKHSPPFRPGWQPLGQ